MEAAVCWEHQNHYQTQIESHKERPDQWLTQIALDLSRWRQTQTRFESRRDRQDQRLTQTEQLRYCLLHTLRAMSA